MSVKTPRFSGPFKWSALRQQLLSLRDDVHTIRKVAGRNVTIDEHRGKGKIINATRERGSASPPTGCDCPLPSGDCPHSICVEFMLDGDDTSDHDIIELISAGDILAFYFEPSDSTWNIYGNDDSASLPATDPFNRWIRVVMQFTSNGDGTVHTDWSVDGVSGAGIDSTWNCLRLANSLKIGAASGSGSPHRSIRLSVLKANPVKSGETDFCFPSTAFDGLVGTATIDGSGFLRIDAPDDGSDNYAFRGTSLDMDCTCCLGRDVTEISTLSVAGSVSGTTDSCGCHFDAASPELSATWDRINHDVSFTPGAKQFKLWFSTREGDDAKCDLNFEIQGDGPSADVFQDCESCTPNDCSPGQKGQIRSILGINVLISVYNDPAGGGTITLSAGGSGQIGCWRCPDGSDWACQISFSGSGDNTAAFTQDSVSTVSTSVSQEDTFEGGCVNEGFGCKCNDPCEGSGGFDCYPCDTPSHCPSCSLSSVFNVTATLA